MATQAPNGSYITIVASDQSLATSVSTDGKTWTTFSNGTKINNLLVQDKLYIKYSEQGSGNFKKNITSVTNQSGTSLTITDDNTNHYSIVTVPSGTTSINIEYVAFSDVSLNYATVKFKFNNNPNKIFITYNGGNVTDTASNLSTNGIRVPIYGTFGQLDIHRMSCLDDNDNDLSATYNGYFVSYIGSPTTWTNNNSYHNTISIEANEIKTLDVYVDTHNNNPISQSFVITNTLQPFKFYGHELSGGVHHISDNTYQYCVDLSQFNTSVTNKSKFTLNSLLPKNYTDVELSNIDGKLYISSENDFAITDAKLNKIAYVKCVGETTSNYPYVANVTVKPVKDNLFYNEENNYILCATSYSSTVTFNNKNIATGSGKDNIYINYYTEDSSRLENIILYQGKSTNVKFDNFRGTKYNQFKFNDIYAYGTEVVMPNTHFVPYIIYKNTYQFCWDTKFWNWHTLSNSNGVSCDIVSLPFEFVSPAITMPKVDDNNFKIHVKSTRIDDDVTNGKFPSTTAYYQYTKTNPTAAAINNSTGSLNLGNWSKYGFNVKNTPYQLSIQTVNIPTGYTRNFDLYLGDTTLKPNIADDAYNYSIYVNKNYTYQYFYNNISTFDIYPTNYIKYDTDSTTQKDEKLSKIKFYLNFANGNNNTYNGYFYNNFNVSANAKNKIDQLLKISEIPDDVNIDYVSVKCETPNTTKTSRIYNVQNNSTILESTGADFENTWIEYPLTYTFSIVTKKPEEPTIKAHDYGLKLNTTSLGVSEYYIEINNDYIISEISGEENPILNNNKTLYHSNDNYNNKILYIDKKDGINIPSTFWIRLYLTTDDYYVTNNTINPTFNTSSNTKCNKEATLYLSGYIKSNIKKIYKSIIKLNNIGIEYEAYLGIIKNSDTSTVCYDFGGAINVPSATYKPLPIPDEYANDPSYNIIVTRINGIVNGSQIPIERYNIGLIPTLPASSDNTYNYETIKVTNNTNTDVFIISYYSWSDSSYWTQHTNTNICIPAGIQSAYLYFDSKMCLGELTPPIYDSSNNLAYCYMVLENESITITPMPEGASSGWIYIPTDCTRGVQSLSISYS